MLLEPSKHVADIAIDVQHAEFEWVIKKELNRPYTPHQGTFQAQLEHHRLQDLQQLYPQSLLPPLSVLADVTIGRLWVTPSLGFAAAEPSANRHDPDEPHIPQCIIPRPSIP